MFGSPTSLESRDHSLTPDGQQAMKRLLITIGISSSISIDIYLISLNSLPPFLPNI